MCPVAWEEVRSWLLHWLRASRLVPILLGLVLLAAAFFKTHELATEELSEQSLLASRWFLGALVLFELGLGVWLLGGLAPATTRWIALITFVAFFEAALYQAVMGYESCRCVGKVSLNPWYPVIFDCAAVAALLAWRPDRGAPPIASRASGLAWIAWVFVCLAFPVVLNIVYYVPGGIMHGLRRDERLRILIDLKVSQPRLQALLEELSRRTGLTIQASEELHKLEPDFGTVEVGGVPAWSVMEHVARKQGVGARWHEVNGGYVLKPAPILARGGVPWILAGVLLAGAAVAWRLFGFTGRGRTLR